MAPPGKGLALVEHFLEIPHLLADGFREDRVCAGFIRKAPRGSPCQRVEHVKVMQRKRREEEVEVLLLPAPAFVVLGRDKPFTAIKVQTGISHCEVHIYQSFRLDQYQAQRYANQLG